MDCLIKENQHLQVIGLVDVELVVFEVKLSGLRIVVEFPDRRRRPFRGSLCVRKHRQSTAGDSQRDRQTDRPTVQRGHLISCT